METFLQILLSGDSVIMWVAAGLLALIGRYVVAKIGSEKIRTYVGRAVMEVSDAVKEVYQTYVSALKASNVDGRLTDDEQAEAFTMALDIAKSNLGAKGLERLARILGIGSDPAALDAWLGTKVESAVASLKSEVASSAAPLSKTP